MATNKDSLVN